MFYLFVTTLAYSKGPKVLSNKQLSVRVKWELNIKSYPKIVNRGNTTKHKHI